MINSGILLIDKPAGISSFDVIRKLRKITGIRKMGHAGTLDPFASGLLIICLGKATRVCGKIVTNSKEYIAKLRLGQKTDSGDLTGKVLQTKEINHISETEVQDLIPGILAIRQQVPPRFSAIKVNGKKAYELARQGREFNLKARPIEIRSFSFENIAIPEIIYKAEVSKGTYIRVLSETIAEMLGNIGVTTELRRTAIGHVRVENACQLDDLNSENWQEKLFPLSDLFKDYDRIEISKQEKADFKQGRRFKVEASDTAEIIVSCQAQVIGFGEIEKGILKPRIVMI